MKISLKNCTFFAVVVFSSSLLWASGVENLIGKLYMGTKKEKKQAAKQLGYLGAKAGNAVDALLFVAENDPSGPVRWEAGKALGKIPSAFPVVAKKLGSSSVSWDKKYYLMQGLGYVLHRKNPKEIKKAEGILLGLLKHKDTTIRQNAAVLLALRQREMPKKVREGLMKVIEKDKSEYARSAAAYALGFSNIKANSQEEKLLLDLYRKSSTSQELRRTIKEVLKDRARFGDATPAMKNIIRTIEEKKEKSHGFLSKLNTMGGKAKRKLKGLFGSNRGRATKIARSLIKTREKINAFRERKILKQAGLWDGNDEKKYKAKYGK